MAETETRVDPAMEARCWIKCESHADLMALRDHILKQDKENGWDRGPMTEPGPHRRFYTCVWPSPPEGRGTSLEWEMALRNGAEQASMLLDGFDRAFLFAIHVQPVGTDQDEYPRTVPALEPAPESPANTQGEANKESSPA